MVLEKSKFSPTFSPISNASQGNENRTYSFSRTCSGNHSHYQNRKVAVKNTYNPYLVYLSLLVLFAIVGNTTFLQTFTFVFTKFNGLNNRNNELENFVKIQKTTASLARVLNAIVLLKDVNESSKVTKKMLAEAINVHNVSLLDSIDKTDSNDIIQVLGKYASLADQKMETIKKIYPILNSFQFRNGYASPESTTISPSVIQLKNVPTSFPSTKNTELGTLSTASFIKILSTFYFPNLDFNGLKSKIIILEQELNTFKTKRKDAGLTDNEFQAFETIFIDLFKDINQKLFELAHAIDGRVFDNFIQKLKLFITEIKQYKILTNQTFFKAVADSLVSIETTTKNIQSFANYTNNTRIREKTSDLNTILSTKIMVSDKKYLVGFPRGSTDFVTLFKDLDNANFGQFLNHGRSLAKLKNVLKPVLDVGLQVSKAKEVWPESARKTHSNVISNLTLTLNGIWKFESNSVLKSLTKMNANLKKVLSVFKLNQFILEEFQQLLNPFHGFLKFKHCLKTLSNRFNMTESKLLRLENIFSNSTSLTNKNESASKLEHFLNAHLDFQLLNQSVIFLENQSKKLVNSFANITDLRKIVTEENFSEIRNAVQICQQFEADIKQVNNNFSLLHFLVPLQKKEKEEVSRLTEFYFPAKNIINQWKNLEKNLNLKLKKEKGFICLTKFDNVSDITIQLADSLRFLSFYQNPDLYKYIKNYLTNNMDLLKKAEDMSSHEQYHLFGEHSDFSDFNILVNNFLLEIETLPSQFSNETLNLRTFGSVLFRLNNFSIFKQDFSRMISIVNDLKQTSLKQSKEIVVAEQLLHKIRNLQLEAELKRNTLHELMPKVHEFFGIFFAERVPSTYNMSIWPVVVTFFSMLLSCACGPVCYWCRTTIDEVREKTRY